MRQTRQEAEAAPSKQKLDRLRSKKKVSQDSLKQASLPLAAAAEAGNKGDEEGCGGGVRQVLRPAKELSGWSARCVTFTAQWAQHHRTGSAFAAGLVVTGTNNNSNNNKYNNSYNNNYNNNNKITITCHEMIVKIFCSFWS